jgi:DDE superfamily endonuclease
VALNGKVLWVSPAYPGSINNIQIAHETAHVWLEQLHGLGDAGFKRLEDIHIQAPPSCNNPFYSVYAIYHIAAENALADAKDWHCMKDLIRDSLVDEIEMLETQHQKWVIVCVLKNEYNKRGND